MTINSSLGIRKENATANLKTIKFEKDRLDKSGFYYLRFISPDESSVQSFLPSCQLIASELQEKLTVFLDNDSKRLIGVNYSGENRGCEKSTTAIKPKSSVELGSTSEAYRIVFPAPKPEHFE